MRLAVVSDIHSNLEAFQAVLKDIEASKAQAIISLGDNIGYGPNPEEVMHLLKGHKIPSVMGNHELGLTCPETLEWFDPYAQEALLKTAPLLSPESLRHIRTLPIYLIQDECLFVHGCPPADIRTYLFELSSKDLLSLFESMEQDICFVGHTHYLEITSYIAGRVRRQALGPGTLPLSEGCKFIVNAGSVGQPRDGDNRAKYVLWDTHTRILTVRLVPYDMRKTTDKIIALGLPRIYADRLW